MAPIILVGGSKGGVGKSLVCTALVDYLRHHNRPALLIEADRSNPDVWKAHHEELDEDALPLDLEAKDGWISLADALHAKPNHTALINSPAPFNQRIASFGDLLRRSLSLLQRPLIVLWVINRQRDTLELLKEFCQLLAEVRLHVLRNGHFGEESKFELYNGSELIPTHYRMTCCAHSKLVRERIRPVSAMRFSRRRSRHRRWPACRGTAGPRGSGRADTARPSRWRSVRASRAAGERA